MAAEKRKVCPECNGEKTIQGTCVCDNEWRGTEKEGVCGGRLISGCLTILMIFTENWVGAGRQCRAY